MNVSTDETATSLDVEPIGVLWTISADVSVLLADKAESEFKSATVFLFLAIFQ